MAFIFSFFLLFVILSVFFCVLSYCNAFEIGLRLKLVTELAAAIFHLSQICPQLHPFMFKFYVYQVCCGQQEKEVHTLFTIS